MSYCADDKSDKRVFTFIAKEKDNNQHKCFVFDSDKCVSNSHNQHMSQKYAFENLKASVSV